MYNYSDGAPNLKYLCISICHCNLAPFTLCLTQRTQRYSSHQSQSLRNYPTNVGGRTTPKTMKTVVCTEILLIIYLLADERVIFDDTYFLIYYNYAIDVTFFLLLSLNSRLFVAKVWKTSYEFEVEGSVKP